MIRGRPRSPDAHFALYLRAFATTETLSSQPYAFDRSDSGDPPEHLDLEQVLRVALDGTFPLLAAGRPDDLRGGAGRLVLPSHRWQPIVADLARRAELVLIIPSANPGTLWEMRWLRQHRQFERTVFLMPEQQHDDGVQRTMKTTLGSPLAWRFDSEDYYRDHAADWAAAVAAAQAAGIHLPPYQFEGAMFTLNADGTVRKLVGLNVVNHARKITRVRRVLAELAEPGFDRPALPVPDGEVVFRPKRVRHAVTTLAMLVFGTVAFGFASYGLATSSSWFFKVLAVPFGLATLVWPLAMAGKIRIGGDFAVDRPESGSCPTSSCRGPASTGSICCRPRTAGS